jgi:hypothetical protein
MMTDDTELPIAERLGVAEKQEAFNKALLGEDPLGAIIRAHIYIEHEVNAFIESQLADPQALGPLHLDYDGRVQLAVALGLPAGMKPALSNVGKLRNRFAHRLEASIGKQEVDGLKKAMGEDFQVALGSLARTDQKMGKPPRKWADLEPKDQITLLLITLWGKLTVINAQIRQEMERPSD